jgi:hypothetical protein
LRQETLQFEASLANIARPYLKIKKKKSDIKGAGIPGIAAM